MKITLAPELERFVEEKVLAGQYESADEVVNSAVAMLRQQETLSAEDVAEMRREIAIGLEQLDRGDSAPWQATALKDKLRRKPGRE
jgi:antitoxin ParD1/3/4